MWGSRVRFNTASYVLFSNSFSIFDGRLHICMDKVQLNLPMRVCCPMSLLPSSLSSPLVCRSFMTCLSPIFLFLSCQLVLIALHFLSLSFSVSIPFVCTHSHAFTCGVCPCVLHSSLPPCAHCLSCFQLPSLSADSFVFLPSFLVGGKWFSQWMYHLLGFGKGTSSLPGPLDNSGLLKCECCHWSEHELKGLCPFLSTTAIAGDELREKLVEHSDFNILPKSMWINLSKSYGLSVGSRPISRYETIVCVCVCLWNSASILHMLCEKLSEWGYYEECDMEHTSVFGLVS